MTNALVSLIFQFLIEKQMNQKKQHNYCIEKDELLSAQTLKMTLILDPIFLGQWKEPE